MVDNQTNYVRDISDLIHDTYGNQIKIFLQSIPFSVRAAEISAEEISIFEHLHSFENHPFQDNYIVGDTDNFRYLEEEDR